MGQALTKCFNPDAAGAEVVGPIDQADLRPRGLYPNQSVDKKKFKKQILKGTIAPCYMGVDEDPDGTLEECPICLLHYPALNRCQCTMGICTECFLEVGKTTHDPPCPFCQTAPFAVDFKGPLPAEERLAARKERDASKAAEARAQESESQHGSWLAESNIAEEAGPSHLPAHGRGATAHQTHRAMNEPLRPPVPDEDISAERKPTVAIHASSGSSSNSPVSSQQSEAGKSQGTEAGSGHSGQDVASNPTGRCIVAMTFCSYNSRPLPPLFAMLAAFSGMEGEDSEASLPMNSHAVTPDGAPCPHASTAAASSEMHSTAISTDSYGSEGVQQASSKGDASIVHGMEDAGSCSGQHATPSCPESHIDANMEADQQDLNMAAQSSAEQKCAEYLHKQSSCETYDHQAILADEESNTVLHRFGINEPVLMINPDGSKVYVLLSDEQAAKEKADQMRQEREAAAIAAAKAATYWAPSDEHDAEVLAAIEQGDAAVRQRYAQSVPIPAESSTTYSPPAEASSSGQQVPEADDSFEARCRAADEALTAIINRRDAEVAARATAGQP